MNSSSDVGAFLVGTVVIVVGLFGLIAGGAWLFSINAVDAGEVCVVQEGGPFDGRNITEVRQPGSGPKPIGAFNKHACLPTTERDSNDVLEENPQFPTQDSVLVTADGQVLFSLTTDEAKIRDFYRKFGRRKWDGHEIDSDEGWLAFLRQRFAPVVLDAQRQVIGEYDCTELNNLCQYVIDPEAAIREGDVERVDNNQNLSEAQGKIAEHLNERLVAAFGDTYFENVRYQNLRIRFEQEVQERITQAQSKRTEVATAQLEAQRKNEEAKGETRVAREQARQIRIKAQGYRSNPVQGRIDALRAFCGADGCNPQAIGGDVFNQITGGGG